MLDIDLSTLADTKLNCDNKLSKRPLSVRLGHAFLINRELKGFQGNSSNFMEIYKNLRLFSFIGRVSARFKLDWAIIPTDFILRKPFLNYKLIYVACSR